MYKEDDMDKYKLTKETMVVAGVKLYRIKALKSFGDVEEGSFGGFVESTQNLSQEGTCWINDNACVMDDARVQDSARLFDNAFAGGSATIKDNSLLLNKAVVTDSATIAHYAVVANVATISGKALVCDKAIVKDHARVQGFSVVKDNANVTGFVSIGGFFVAIENTIIDRRKNGVV